MHGIDARTDSWHITMIKQNFVNKWHAEINKRPNSTIETYMLYKPQYVSEIFFFFTWIWSLIQSFVLLYPSAQPARITGRYTRPKVNPENRLCPLCYVVDNEINFVVRCRINETLRITLWNKINATDSGFAYLDDKDKFSYLMSCCDRNILSWFGKFVYQSFNIRNQKIHGFA